MTARRRSAACFAAAQVGGRNNLGRVTSRHRGGGHKRYYRIIDFKRDKLEIPAVVASIEYDPNRSANIALLNYSDGEKRYILAPVGLQVGDSVLSGASPEIRPGNAMPLEKPARTFAAARDGRRRQMARVGPRRSWPRRTIENCVYVRRCAQYDYEPPSVRSATRITKQSVGKAAVHAGWAAGLMSAEGAESGRITRWAAVKARARGRLTPWGFTRVQDALLQTRLNKTQKVMVSTMARSLKKRPLYR